MDWLLSFTFGAYIVNLVFLLSDPNPNIVATYCSAMAGALLFLLMRKRRNC